MKNKMYFFKKKKEEGFIALTSVSLLSGFFIILFMGMFFSATEGVERVLDREKSVKALSLANSCAEIALNELWKDVNYIGGEMKAISGDLCEIKDVQYFGIYGVAIKTEAGVDGQYKKIQVEIDTENWPLLEIIDWREVSLFSEFLQNPEAPEE
jgi:hypothetical protein